MQTQINQTTRGAAAAPANPRGSTVQILAAKLDLSLLTTLRLIAGLQHGPLTRLVMRRQLGLTDRNLQYHILEAIHFGAAIMPHRIANSPVVYELRNWPEIAPTVTRWLELESKRS